MARGAARTAQGGEGTHAAQRRTGAATPGAAVGADRQGVPVRDRSRAALRWQTSSRGARSFSSTTSCSGPTTRRGARRARRSRTGSTVIAVHLANHDVTLTAVSRAPLAKLLAYQQRMGWTFPWASSAGSDFNFDFNIVVHRSAAARGRPSNTTTSAAAMRWTRRRRRSPSSSSQPPAEPTRPRTRATGPA